MSNEDVSIYHKWRNDIEVMQYTNPTLDVFTYADTERFVNSVIEEISANKLIGVTSLINMDYVNRNAECIIDIGDKNYWSKGFGGEAFNLLLDFAFKELNLHKVYLRVFSFNVRAIKLYQKLGFVEEGKLEEQLYRDGKWHDINFMGLLRKNYKR